LEHELAAGDVTDVRHQLVDDEARERNRSATRAGLGWAEVEVAGDLDGRLSDVDPAAYEVEPASAPGEQLPAAQSAGGT